MDLNPAQHDAVNTLSGPLLVLAGAGTGKTRVVTYRIAQLMRSGIRPARILAVTFTNKAAGEMRERALALIGKRTKSTPEISTFHSLCVRVLKRHARRLGYPAAFAIYDRGDQEGVARGALREIRAPSAVMKPGDLIWRISGWKTAGVRPDRAAALAETDKDHLAAAAYRRYQNALKTAGAMDFDDLLLLTEELFAQHPEALRTEAGRFDHLLVDEYQDTNGVQYRIVKALAEGHRNLCVVGDDDQSIYGWRGAEVTHILRFKRDWPEAKVVRLEVNYRSTQEILAWANRLIAYNKVRHDKRLRSELRGESPRILQCKDETEEAKTVVGEIGAAITARRRKARDFAILCRTNEQPRSFEAELRRAKIPYVLLGGMSFFDRKEVRDLMAYIKLLAKPRDEVALLRIINTPPRGIGQTTVRKLMQAAIATGKPAWDMLAAPSRIEGVNDSAREGIRRLRELVARYREQSKRLPLGRLIRGLVDELGYRDELARLYPKPEDRDARWAAVEELMGTVENYGRRAARPSLAGFLQQMALSTTDDDRDKESKLDRDAVALMTLHAAKGLEFPEVYMVGMEENLLPHHRSIGADGAAVDEERRLCYVGVTRAQRRLTLSLALSRTKWGKPRPTQPSRFLYELTGQADNPNYLVAIGKRRRKDVEQQRRRPAASKNTRRRGPGK